MYLLLALQALLLCRVAWAAECTCEELDDCTAQNEQYDHAILEDCSKQCGELLQGADGSDAAEQCYIDFKKIQERQYDQWKQCIDQAFGKPCGPNEGQDMQKENEPSVPDGKGKGKKQRRQIDPWTFSRMGLRVPVHVFQFDRCVQGCLFTNLSQSAGGWWNIQVNSRGPAYNSVAVGGAFRQGDDGSKSVQNGPGFYPGAPKAPEYRIPQFRVPEHHIPPNAFKAGKHGRWRRRINSGFFIPAYTACAFQQNWTDLSPAVAGRKLRACAQKISETEAENGLNNLCTCLKASGVSGVDCGKQQQQD